MKKVLKYSSRSVEVFFAFLFFYLLFVLITGIFTIGEKLFESDFYIYVQTNGIHTDIVLPTQSTYINWTDFISKSDFPNAKSFDYCTIGWGDKGFFIKTREWSDLTLSTAINAVFMPSETAMHVKFTPEPIPNATCKKVFIDKTKIPILIGYIKKSFKLKKGKPDLIVNSAYTDYDNFYEANGNYHLFKTCNIWTNRGLKTLNVKTSIYGLYSYAIMNNL